VVFILATPRTGAGRVLRALGQLPGVAAAPVPSRLFEQGIATLLDYWILGGDTNRPQGMFHLADDQQFTMAARLLADVPLDAVRTRAGADLIVEWSPGHPQAVDLIEALYPDATLIHLVADGRSIATRMSLGVPGMPAAQAARWWCDDQRSVAASGHPNLHTARVEDIVPNPKAAITDLAALIGIDAGSSLDDAALELDQPGWTAAEVPAGRAAALVEALGAEVLEQFGYQPGLSGTAAVAAAKAEWAFARTRTAGHQLVERVKFAAETYRHHRRRLTHQLAQEGRDELNLRPKMDRVW
jgi:hypothetical protein